MYVEGRSSERFATTMLPASAGRLRVGELASAGGAATVAGRRLTAVSSLSADASDVGEALSASTGG
eukprot:6938227-Lingulodinium_polyedra.AAC.1